MLFVSGTLVYCVTRFLLLKELDSKLSAEAIAFSSMVVQEVTGTVVEIGEIADHSYRDSEDPAFYLVSSIDGTVLGQSPSVDSNLLAVLITTSRQPQLRSITLPNGRAGRIAEFSFSPALDDETTPTTPGGDNSLPRTDPPMLVLGVARSTANVTRSLTTLTTALLSVLAGGMLVLIPLLRTMINSALVPLEQTAQRLAGIDLQSLSERIDITESPTEIAVVLKTLNELLARLQATVIREQQFTANAAHELRTPLAGLRATLDVALMHPHDSEYYRLRLQECLYIVQQLDGLVHQLLAIARIDSGQFVIRSVPVPVADLVASICREFSSDAVANELAVVQHAASNAVALSDPDCVAIIVRNIVNNAISYCNRSGEVAIRVEEADDQVRVVVQNTGNRLSPEQMSRVCERFWRGDESRNATGQRAGLGLSISRDLSDRLGGTLTVTAEPPDWFVVVFCLPAACGSSS